MREPAKREEQQPKRHFFVDNHNPIQSIATADSPLAHQPSVQQTIISTLLQYQKYSAGYDDVVNYGEDSRIYDNVDSDMWHELSANQEMYDDKFCQYAGYFLVGYWRKRQDGSRVKIHIETVNAIIRSLKEKQLTPDTIRALFDAIRVVKNEFTTLYKTAIGLPQLVNNTYVTSMIESDKNHKPEKGSYGQI